VGLGGASRDDTNDFFVVFLVKSMNDSIWFGPVSLLTDLEAKPQQRTKSLILCPGSEIRLARPELKRQVRIQLDLPDVRLQDLVESDWQ
jgi:hypothetical protein